MKKKKLTVNKNRIGYLKNNPYYNIFGELEIKMDYF